MTPIENSGPERTPASPDRAPDVLNNPANFADKAAKMIQDWLKGNNLGRQDIQQMRGQQGGILDRIAGFFRSFNTGGGGIAIGGGRINRGRRGGPNRMGRRGRRGGGGETLTDRPVVSEETPAISPAEGLARMQNLRQTLPGIQFRDIPIDGGPDAFAQFCSRYSIRGGDMKAYVEKMEANAQRITQEVTQRPGWQNTDAWGKNVLCDGLRIWAFNQATGESCVSTGGQLLFEKGTPDAIKSRMQKNGDKESTIMMQTMNKTPVQWDITSMGERYTMQTGGATEKVFSRNNDGFTRERKRNGSNRPDFIMHVADTTVARVNTGSAALPTSMRIEDMRSGEQLPQGTYAKMSNGEWLGKASQEVRKRGLNGYVDMLARMPDRELASYVAGIMYDQIEDVYGTSGPLDGSVNFAFDRTDRTVAQMLMAGRGDCRGVAKLVEMVWRRKGYNCITIAVEPDHMMAVRIVPSGDPQRPFAAIGIGNNGYWDKFEPGRTAGEALANTWDTHKGPRPSGAQIMNDRMRLARSTYEAVGSRLLNNA